MQIPITKRKPPDTDDAFLCWSNNFLAPILLTGKMINRGLKKDGEHYFITKWMRVQYAEKSDKT